jgi:hypothetical protein
MCEMAFLASNERRKLFSSEKEKLEKLAKENGKLRRQDWWSLEYFRDPYLVDATTDKLHKRYQDIVGNLMVLDKSGRIAPLMGKDRDHWMSRTMHVQDELFTRGLRPNRADDDIHISNPTFPNIPPGLLVLKGRELPDQPYLVRIGEYAHMASMLEDGVIRTAPASTWSDKSLTSAIKDNELEVSACYSVSDIMRTTLGRSVSHKFDLNRPGEITLRRTLPDFYAFCCTHKYDHRLLDDFHKDTIVLIRDPKKFLSDLAAAIRLHNSSLSVRIGPIKYYDPYGVEDWDRNTDGFLKHFRYAYQNEFRICCTLPAGAPHKFEPFFVTIGSMRKYAELLTLTGA